MHLGNYAGAVRRWVDAQPAAGSEAADSFDAVYCIVDLHAMTVAYEPSQLRERTLEMATLLMAAGLAPDRSLLFVQSHVRAHAQLSWILNCTATMGELRRMTQFKEKSASQESVSAALFDYPVLMAADILAYDTDEVPVGDDQRQHLELARDVAVRFNQRYGDTFVVPRATFPEIGARIMDLQTPSNKMSKSVDSPRGTVGVLDEPTAIAKKFRAAVTDSASEVAYDPEARPGVSNLIDIYAVATDSSVASTVDEFGGGQYGPLKVATADAVVEYLRPLRARYRDLRAEPDAVSGRLRAGAAAAAELADGVVARAEGAVGLLEA